MPDKTVMKAIPLKFSPPLPTFILMLRNIPHLSLELSRVWAFGPSWESNLSSLPPLSPSGFSQETTKDPKIKGSRSQQRSVTALPPLSDCTETQ